MLFNNQRFSCRHPVELVLLRAPEDGHHQPRPADAHQRGDHTPFRLGERAQWGLEASRCWVDNCLQEHFWLLTVRQKCGVLIFSLHPVFRILLTLIWFKIKDRISFVFAQISPFQWPQQQCLEVFACYALSCCRAVSVGLCGGVSMKSRLFIQVRAVHWYKEVYNTMESHPGKVICQAKYKKSILQCKLCHFYWQSPSFCWLYCDQWAASTNFGYLLCFPWWFCFYVSEKCFQWTFLLVLGLLLSKGIVLQMPGK